MTGTRGTGRALARLLLLTLCVAAALAALSASAWADDNPPTIYDPGVSPTSLPTDGGQFTVQARIDDDISVAFAWVEIHTSNGGSDQALLTPYGGDDEYTATYDAGPNYSDTPLTYTLTIHARDSGNNEVELPVPDTVTVAGDSPPTLSDPSVSPRSLAAGGGPVTIAATATDDRTVNVYATVTLPDGTTQLLNLDAGDASRFQGTFTAPANTTASPAQYGVTITAQDNVGNQVSADGGSFTVAAQAAPSAGRLVASPKKLSFGSVATGRSVRKVVTIVNSGPRTTTPIKGTITVAGGPAFSIAGAGSSGLSFKLARGQSKSVTVVFKPTTTGHQAGSLSITRADGGQPGLAVALTGTGAKHT
jgi:hypothetical protein